MRAAWKFFLFLGISILPLGASCQYGWWNEHVDWDGYTPWTNYLNIAPGFMGPNALPVPFPYKGLVRKKLELELRTDWNGGFGDESRSLFSRAYWPVIPRWIAVEFSMVPFEAFRTDTLIRNARNTRLEDARGVATGDLYVNMLIQLLRDHRWMPDLLLGLHLRTASGNQLEQARYTDAPGYWFDLSLGKTFYAGRERAVRMRAHAMTGFYVWQTYSLLHPQNDAIMYGLGFDLAWNSMSLEQDLSGYSGYLGEGDQPLVYRAALGFGKESWRIRFHYGYGIKDYPYHSFRLGITFYLKVSSIVSELNH